MMMEVCMLSAHQILITTWSRNCVSSSIKAWWYGEAGESISIKVRMQSFGYGFFPSFVKACIGDNKYHEGLHPVLLIPSNIKL